MFQRKKSQTHDQPASIRVLGRQALQEVIGGSVRITGTDPAPRPDNRDF